MSTKKAKESSQVSRARNKLKRQLNVEHKQFTSEALNQMAETIRLHIKTHHPEKGFLKKKKFVLFDENQHSANTKSLFINKLYKMLRSSPKTSIK